MQALYIVELSEGERKELEELLRGGSVKVRKAKRAQILLASDRRRHLDREVAKAVGCGTSTVYRTRRRYVEGGLDHALTDVRSSGPEEPGSSAPRRRPSSQHWPAASPQPVGRTGRWSYWLAKSYGSRITKACRRRPSDAAFRRTS